MSIPQIDTLVCRVSVLVCLWVSTPVLAAEVAKSPHGPTDQRSVLNTLTTAQSLTVLQRVSSGKVYDLSVDYFVGMPGLADYIVKTIDRWFPRHCAQLHPMQSRFSITIAEDA